MKRPVGVQIRMAPEGLVDKIMRHFNKRLREWMDERGVRLIDIAQALGISYSYVAFLGKDKPYGRLLSAENAVLLAEYLNVSPDEIFAAMGQVNPFLAEEVPVEVLERELIELHERLRSHLRTLRKEGGEREKPRQQEPSDIAKAQPIGRFKDHSSAG